MHMWRCLLFLVVLATFPAATGEAAQGGGKKATYGQANVKWQFDIRHDRDGNPQSRVFLVVGGRRVFLLRVVALFRVLDRQDYSSRDVPATAITACTGWWAGSGEDLYVIRRNRQLIVFIRSLDEQTPVPAYKRLKVIPLPR